MLLRNYDNIIVARRRPVCSGYMKGSTDVDANVTVFGNGDINFKDTDGVLRPIYNCSSWYYNPLSCFIENDCVYSQTSLNGGNSNLIAGGYSASLIGTDNEPTIAPMSYDDYKLSSYFTTSQVARVSSTQKILTPIYNKDDNTWTYTYQRTFSAKENIVLREIGVIAGAYYNEFSTYCRDTLVYRKVLDEPIEVPADASFILSFTMTISANENIPADYVATASVE